MGGPRRRITHSQGINSGTITRCKCNCSLGPSNSKISENGEDPGDHNHQDSPKSTAIQMGGVLQYKWGVYCDTHGRSTDNIPLSSESRGAKVLQYKLEAYCSTNWRRIAVLF